MELDPRLEASDLVPVASVPESSSIAGRTTGFADADTPSTNLGAARDQDLQRDGDGDDDHHSGDDQDGGADPKRSRACEACRGLKVRCDPDPDGGPCKRCKKASRKCVVTQPTRKRQKKTDSRVSELERKIDALTASLQARAGGIPVLPALGVSPSPHVLGANSVSPGGGPNEHTTPGSHGSSYYRAPSTEGVASGGIGSHERSWGSETATVRHGSLDRSNGPSVTPPGGGSAAAAPPQARVDPTPPAFQPPMVIAGQKRKLPTRWSANADDEHRQLPATAASSSFTPVPDSDVVDRGILTMAKATELFARYRDRMAPNLPAVVHPPSMTVSDLRKNKPVLFLSTMAAAASEDNDLQKVLSREVMLVFADKVFLSGDKSVEIVQALLVAVVWYWPPEHFEELKFYQLVHSAAVMAIDIGLGKSFGNKQPGTGLYNWQSHPMRRQALPDPTTVESRRTWLACFFMASNTSISLRRPNLIRWTPFMAESLEVLESSPDAAPSDKYFCHLVWTHKLGEEVSNQFALEDATARVNINEARTQHTLRALERELENKRNSVPEDIMRPALTLGFEMINLYMHEIVLHSKTAVDQIRPPFNTDAFKEGVIGPEPLSAAHINAISSCLSAINGIFTTFLSLDVVSVRCLPVYNFVRVAYALVILLKMYFTSSNPTSDLGKVVNKENLRVGYYMDLLIDKFRATAADDRSRPASKFLVVLAMLKSWFIKQGKLEAKNNPQGGDGAGSTKSPSWPEGDGSAGNKQLLPFHRQNPQQQQQEPPRVNTPLQLLSEVATGTGANKPSGSARFLLGSFRNQPQPFFYEANNNNNTNTPSSSASDGSPAINPTTGPQQTSQPQQQPPFFAASSAAAASSEPAWMSNLPTNIDMGLADGTGLDFTNLGLTPEFQLSSEDLQEPWISDLFQGFQDAGGGMFPF
ncbi:unnamed protein product [Clonostachys rosea f. rosea IK726]|uniref:Zn(2)-C6 fungal-type domain-containing protein n=3 Tax=Bionectria ochroleuca TaxID=29856 RepID=A0A0B7JQ65_BIOOC|nr:unnamed protein product [Clonostachys rosea f. rosea IK726]